MDQAQAQRPTHRILADWRAAERVLSQTTSPSDRERLQAEVDRFRLEFQARSNPDPRPAPPEPTDLATTPIYSIGAVARMVDVPVATLRTWEDRYDGVRPTRSEGGQRLYSRADIERLRFVRARVDEGLSPADAHRLLEDRTGAGLAGPADRDSTRHRLLILLAEHDAFAANIAEYFLRTEGYDVVVSFEADEAATLVGRLAPDVAIVEWLISGGLGAETCRRLKAVSDAPLIVVSGLSVAEAALDAGADAFIRKPIEPLRLVSTVKDLLGESAVTRRLAAAVR